jgi:hypothetical protein
LDPPGRALQQRTVAEGAAALARAEHLVEERVEDHAHHQLPAHCQRY